MHRKISLCILLVGMLVSITACHFFQKSESYYGMKVASLKNVFIIDISGSMEGKVEKDLQGNVVAEATSIVADELGDQIGGDVGGFISSKTKKELTKLAEVKRELIPVIRGLPENSFFNLITFENEVELWKDNLVPANSTNKNLAIAMIENLESGGGTNLYGGLEEAFKLAGPGTTDTNKALNVEEIYLLTDGEPSAGSITSASKILEKIAEINPIKRIKINAIGLGKNKDAKFLQNLADQNMGVYIDK